MKKHRNRRTRIGVLLCSFLLLLGAPAAGDGPEATVMTGFAEVNGTKLYYESAGQGQPMVFIGVGGGMDHRLWDEQFLVFGRQFLVVRYDVRAWGKSAAATEPFSPTEDLAALLDSLKIEKACVVGLSLGGALAIDFAVAHPERVACLVLVTPGLGGYQFSEDFQKRMGPVLAAMREGNAETYVQLLLDDPYLMPAPKNPAAREKAGKIWAELSKLPAATPIGLDPPAIGRLGEIRAPTLLVLGDRDSPDIYAIGRLLESRIAGLRKVVIPESGHMVNMEQPAEFNRVVLEFLRGL